MSSGGEIAAPFLSPTSEARLRPAKNPKTTELFLRFLAALPALIEFTHAPYSG